MLGLEPLLRARLAEIDGFAGGVHGAPELLEAGAAKRLTPCAFVVFDGYGVLEVSPNGRSARVSSRWQVVVAVRQTSDPADGALARAAAQALLSAVTGKLLGWKPAAPYGPLLLADPGGARPSYRAGVLRFPLVVKSEVVVKGD